LFVEEEDGILGGDVTGVQPCAPPISCSAKPMVGRRASEG